MGVLVGKTKEATALQGALELARPSWCPNYLGVPIVLRLRAPLRAFFVLGIVFSAAKPSLATSHPRQGLLQESDDKSKAGELLEKGVAAYREGNFKEAINCFKQARDLDPNSLKAHLYLATAYASQYIPSAPSKENIHLAEKSIEEFKKVLQMDPNNLAAIDGMGSLLYNLGGTPFDPEKFAESKSYHNLHIKWKPADPEPYYGIGVIDWSMAYRKNKELRAAYNEAADKKLRDDEAMPPSLMAAFIREEGSTVDEGIDYLKRAIKLRPNYDDAMAYLNFLYRQKADMEWNSADRENDLKLADDLVDQIKNIKTKKIGSHEQEPE